MQSSSSNSALCYGVFVFLENQLVVIFHNAKPIHLHTCQLKTLFIKLYFFYQFPWQLILFEVKPLHNDFEFGQFIIVPLTSFFCGLCYCNMWTLFNCKRFGCLNSITLLIMLPNAGHSRGLISKGHFFRFLCLFCIIFSCLHTSICVGFILKSITLKKKIWHCFASPIQRLIY